MRVVYDLFRDGLTAINDAADRLNTARQQVSTGRRINAAGDDPLGTELAINEHATIASVDAYTRSRNATAARLSASDNILSGMVDKITSAIVAGMSARGSNISAAVRSAAIDTVNGLSQSLLADINSTFNGDSMFSGTATNAPAYAKVGGVWTYQGNAQTTQVEVERGQLISVNANGQNIIKGSDSTDLFTALDDLATAITNGDNTAIGVSLDALNRAFDRALQAQARLGTDERSVDDASVRLSALRVAAETRRSTLEDANMAEAVTRLTQADTAYKAALGAVSSAERLSLLDYLR